MTVDFVAHIIMWLTGFVFFYHIPLCRNRQHTTTIRPTLSIIIPARNEEITLPHLLKSLKDEVTANDEIIVVDDHSDDSTAIIAAREGANVITSQQLPPGWTGKTWACYQGARRASGELLIFMDADTVIEEGGLESIIDCCNKEDGVVSIQPYHKMRVLYEQLSAFFNLVLMAAMGSFTILGRIVKPIGLFGPVIALKKELYLRYGGFEKVKGKIVEDLALGDEFKKQGAELYCYGGRHTVSFRMYPEGIGQLITGWSKGFAMGAVKTSIPVLILIIAWITGSIGTLRNLIQAIVIGDISLITLWLPAYFAYAVQIYWMLYRIGNFKFYTALLFPIPLLFFIIVFIYSLLTIFIRRNVTWKGRKIKVDR